MRININLASQKYEDAREFWLRWGSALAAAALLAILLGFLAWSDYSSSRVSRRTMADLQNRIAALDHEKATAEAILNRPENQGLRQELAFWNTRIAEKSFSWTELFMDLEKIMPARASLQSIQPAITNDNRLRLNIIVTGEKHEDAEELVRRMEASPRFRFPVLKLEVFKPGQNNAPATVQFGIEASYTPELSGSKVSGTSPGKKEGM